MEETPEVQHGPQAYWDNIGEGWRIDCLCGWMSDISDQLMDCGEDFDYHLRKMRSEK
jgi:hypothetical protein